MKKTYKKIKSNSPTSDKLVSTNDSNNKPTMTIKISSANEQTKISEESKNPIIFSKEKISELEENLNKLKVDIDIERNNAMKDSNDLNMKIKELNNEINSLEVNNKYLTNNINSTKKNMKNKIIANNNKISEKESAIDKLNKKIKFNEKMILNSKHNLKLLIKEKNYLQKEIEENNIPEKKENLEKNLEDLYKKENEDKKEIEKLNIIKNEHEITCKRKQKEFNKKIEILKREIEYEQKKKEIFDKIKDKKQNNNKKNGNKYVNNTDIHLVTDVNKNNEIQGINSEKKENKYINKNIFNKSNTNNNNGTKSIFNYYLKQFNENRNKKRYDNFEIRKILNSNVNDVKPFSSFNNESNNNEILNMKLINNKNSSNKNDQQINRTLFTKSEKAILSKLIPDKCLDNYENKYDKIMKQNLSLQSKLNDKIRLKTITKQNNIIKLENSELINNVYHKKKLKLDTKINESNKKKFEIIGKIKSGKKLEIYYDSIYNQKSNQYLRLLKNYRNIYNEIQKGNLFLKKGAQLTQDNILYMDKYGKKFGDNTSFNDINDDLDYGQISQNYEESEENDNNENINENENNNESDNESYNENEGEE